MPLSPTKAGDEIRRFQRRNGHDATLQIFQPRIQRSDSQSAVTVPAVVMPMYVAGIVDAIGTTASIRQSR